MTGTSVRTGRRVALVARYPDPDPAMPQFIPNLGVYMVAAALRAAGLDGLELRLWDLRGGTADALADQIAAWDPDIVGFSAYLWSFPLFFDAARRLKQNDPGRLIVFGGPSARPAMLRLPPFRDAAHIDLLVTGEGETVMPQIVRTPRRDRESLARIGGVAVPTAKGWLDTPKPPPAVLNDLASPYVQGMVPPGGLGVLQTYRGCPFTCSFCEWGVMEAPKNVRSADNLSAEFLAMAAMGLGGALLVDAGLNLNRPAFENLSRAAAETGFFRNRALITEVYPAKVQPRHLEFLAGVGQPYIGVGLQSFDNLTLANVERSYDEARFDATLADLDAVGDLAVEIILGLPGDSPEGFLRSFERARRLPAALRVYHCVVLPSALMVRSPPEHALEFDPLSLKLRACLGWSEKDLRQTAERVTLEAEAAGGQTGEFFWVFPPPGRPRSKRPAA
ncbi:MAG: B12-binding domain-containing radical SAM protein [Rhodobacteraceae bacterium]|nr:B12-binding domain-containing radical SAM protein [Paracoccaceae bacterium]